MKEKNILLGKIELNLQVQIILLVVLFQVITGEGHMVPPHRMHIIQKKVGLILMKKKKVVMKNLQVKKKRKKRKIKKKMEKKQEKKEKKRKKKKIVKNQVKVRHQMKKKIIKKILKRIIIKKKKKVMNLPKKKKKKKVRLKNQIKKKIKKKLKLNTQNLENPIGKKKKKKRKKTMMISKKFKKIIRIIKILKKQTLIQIILIYSMIFSVHLRQIPNQCKIILTQIPCQHLISLGEVARIQIQIIT